MKDKVHITSAVLAIVSGVWAFTANRGIIDEYGWQWDVGFMMLIVYPLIFAFALMAQHYRPAPRVLLVLSGIASLFSVQWLTPDRLYLLCLGAAGFLTGVYELIVQTRNAKPRPKRPVKGGLLITAGVLACLFACQTAASIISAFAEIDGTMLPGTFTISPWESLIPMLIMAALGVFCFKKDWRPSEYFRLFLVGWPLIRLLLWLKSMVNMLLNEADVTMILNLGVPMIATAAIVVFVLIMPQPRKTPAVPAPEEEAEI